MLLLPAPSASPTLSLSLPPSTLAPSALSLYCIFLSPSPYHCCLQPRLSAPVPVPQAFLSLSRVPVAALLVFLPATTYLQTTVLWVDCAIHSRQDRAPSVSPSISPKAASHSPSVRLVSSPLSIHGLLVAKHRISITIHQRHSTFTTSPILYNSSRLLFETRSVDTALLSKHLLFNCDQQMQCSSVDFHVPLRRTEKRCHHPQTK